MDRRTRANHHELTAIIGARFGSGVDGSRKGCDWCEMRPRDGAVGRGDTLFAADSSGDLRVSVITR
jgi:hypothetical protein